MKKINLEWYVLNGTQVKTNFEEYPYCFYETDVRPFNVFDNWPFKEEAIKLAKAYYKSKIKDEDYSWYDEYPASGTPYQKFKFLLLAALRHAEHSRTEYEICVADWPPTFLNKEGKRISIYYGQDHEPIDEVKMDKIDCYTQVLPNADIFAKYVLMTVNGTLLTKEESTNE